MALRATMTIVHVQKFLIHLTRRCCLVIQETCRTNSFSAVQGIRVGLDTDPPFYQTASVLLSDRVLRFIFLSIVMFLF